MTILICHYLYRADIVDNAQILLHMHYNLPYKGVGLLLHSLYELNAAYTATDTRTAMGTLMAK